jgi:hypothetical protein
MAHRPPSVKASLFLLDSMLHTVLPQGIHSQFGEKYPKMIIEDHPHHFAVVEAETTLRMVTLEFIQYVM